MSSTALKQSHVPALILFVVLVAVAASTGAMFEPGAWYEQLAKPSWNPPNAVFGPVWTVLYIGIAIAGWLTWRASARMTVALLLWIAQLVLNWAWSFLFFGLHRPDLALVDILLLLATIFAFIVSARRRSPVASWLFVPYAAWVSFAIALNFSIWRLNGA